jgi:hypothetical protein
LIIPPPLLLNHLLSGLLFQTHLRLQCQRTYSIGATTTATTTTTTTTAAAATTTTSPTTKTTTSTTTTTTTTSTTTRTTTILKTSHIDSKCSFLRSAFGTLSFVDRIRPKAEE